MILRILLFLTLFSSTTLRAQEQPTLNECFDNATNIDSDNPLDRRCMKIIEGRGFSQVDPIRNTVFTYWKEVLIIKEKAGHNFVRRILSGPKTTFEGIKRVHLEFRDKRLVVLDCVAVCSLKIFHSGRHGNIVPFHIITSKELDSDSSMTLNGLEKEVIVWSANKTAFYSYKNDSRVAGEIGPSRILDYPLPCTWARVHPEGIVCKDGQKLSLIELNQNSHGVLDSITIEDGPLNYRIENKKIILIP